MPKCGSKPKRKTYDCTGGLQLAQWQILLSAPANVLKTKASFLFLMLKYYPMEPPSFHVVLQYFKAFSWKCDLELLRKFIRLGVNEFPGSFCKHRAPANQLLDCFSLFLRSIVVAVLTSSNVERIIGL